VPRGIHVRLNLETGQREAKLLDDREERSSEPKVSKGLLGQSIRFLSILPKLPNYLLFCINFTFSCVVDVHWCLNIDLFQHF